MVSIFSHYFGALLGVMLFCFSHLTPISAQEHHVKFSVMLQAPYGMLSEEKISSGYLFDISIEVLKRAAFRDTVKLSPMKRLIRELENGHVDCTFFARTEFAVNKFMLVEPIGKMLVAGVLPRIEVKINSYNDLKKLNIGVPLGVHISPRFEADPDINRVQTVDYPVAVKMLNRGRIDGILGAIDSLKYNMKKLGVPLTKVGKPYPFAELPIWLVCRSDGVDLAVISRLRNAVSILREDGTIAAIIERYVGAPLP
jgi:ABC-type amino acid transport substrate-binding protein